MASYTIYNHDFPLIVQAAKRGNLQVVKFLTGEELQNPAQ